MSWREIRAHHIEYGGYVMRLPPSETLTVEEVRQAVLQMLMRAARTTALTRSNHYIGSAGLTAPPRPMPLPFFLDPEQIRALAPHIDWDRRVGDRIRAFLNFAMENRR